MQVRKYCWLIDFDEVNINIEVDVDEFVCVNIKRNVFVMVLCDRDLLDIEFNRYYIMFDFIIVCFYMYNLNCLNNF